MCSTRGHHFYDPQRYYKNFFIYSPHLYSTLSINKKTEQPKFVFKISLYKEQCYLKT